jgi:outer membrane receptor protein involved in Fe transport
MRNTLLFFWAMMALGTALSYPAHQGAIRGKIIDAENGSSMEGVQVAILENGQQTFTDALGVFQFTSLPAGSYQVVTSLVGYRKETVAVLVIADQSTDLIISLQSAVLQLDAVNIHAHRGQNLGSVSGIDLQLRPLRTSQDALRMVPGLFIAQHAGGGKAEQIFLRGFDLDHGTDINLTVDGMPVNMVSHAHGQGYADLHFLIPEVIGRVNFEKGPYYSRKGNFTTAGYVAFQTKDALDQNMVRLEGGQFDSFRGVGAFKVLDKPGSQAYVASEYAFSNGYFESPQNFERLNVFGKYRAEINGSTLLTASLATFQSEWDASGQIPGRAVNSGLIGHFGAIDPTEGGKTSRSHATLKLASRLADASLTTHQVYLIHYGFDLYSNFTFFLEDSVNGDQIRQKEDRQIFGYNGSYARQDTWKKIRFTTEAGVELRRDLVQDNELSRTLNRETRLESLALGDVAEINASAYVDEVITLTPDLEVNLGLRYDQFRFQYENKLDPPYQPLVNSKGIVSPKLNVHYRPSDALRVYVQAGTGFHSNDSRVVLAGTSRDILPRAYGAEAGFMAKPVGRILLQSSVWWLRLGQEFVYVGDAAVVEPGGVTVRYGVDFSVRWQLADWLFFDADLNLTKPRGLDDEGNPETFIPLAPTHTSIGGLTVKHQGFSGSLRYRYLGDRAANEDYSLTAEGYLLWDAVANFQFGPVQVGVSVENLGNVLWREAQFETESRLAGEAEPVTEVNFTPGTPFFARSYISFSW